jgi:microcystin-dependent protein
MADPFLGQILIVGFNFAPKGWATCDGQLLPISQNTALFSLLGTNYGGNGQTTFGLPNLQDRTPLGAGQGPGLSNYDLGQVDGSETVTLTTGQLPQHTHTLVADNSVSGSGTPTGTEVFAVSKGAKPGAVNVYDSTANLTAMDPSALSAVGGGQPHNNRQPYLGVLFIIAMQGIFPSRN